MEHNILLTLTVPWEEPIVNTEQRNGKKMRKYWRSWENRDGLSIITTWQWEGARSFIERKVTLFERRFACFCSELRELIRKIQEAVDKDNVYIWLRREDLNDWKAIKW